MTQLPWNFEPCSPEDARDPAGTPWQHAVRGRKPAGRLVLGYGHTPTVADADARTKASQYDEREMLGQRGEVVTGMGMWTGELHNIQFIPRVLTDNEINELHEALGERGELQLRMSTHCVDDCYMITVYNLATGDALVQGQLVSADFYMPPRAPMSGLGSTWTATDFSMMPMGT